MNGQINTADTEINARDGQAAVTPEPAGAPDTRTETAGFGFSWVRVVLFGLIISLLCAASLYMHNTVLAEFHDYLIETDSKNSAWIVSQLSFMLPFLTMIIFQCVVYAPRDAHDGIAQREMLWQTVIVAVLVYGALLPHIACVSKSLTDAAVAAGEELERFAVVGEKSTTYGGTKTLLLETLEWFIRFCVPLGLMTLYRSTKYKREKDEYQSRKTGTPDVADTAD